MVVGRAMSAAASGRMHASRSNEHRGSAPRPEAAGRATSWERMVSNGRGKIVAVFFGVFTRERASLLLTSITQDEVICGCIKAGKATGHMRHNQTNPISEMTQATTEQGRP